MAVFYYQARDLKGQPATGMIEADSENAAAEILTERDLTVVSLIEKKEWSGLRSFTSSLNFFRRIKIKDLVIFSRQLAVMVSATIPIVQALRTLIIQTTNINLKIIISEVADEVEGGAKLSLSLSRYPKVFNSFFINLIKSGETAGQLDEVLNYLADQQEKDYDLKAKIRGAMIYPAFIFVGLIVVSIVMMIFVVPQLTSMLLESGGVLPLSTRLLIGVSNFMSKWWWTMALVIIGLIAAFRFYVKTERGRWQWDWLKIKWPVFGQLFKKIYLVRFTRSMCTLIAGGVSLTQGLEIVSRVVNNVIFEDLIMRTVKEVEGGNSIALVFLQSKNIPPMLSQMMVIGEQTGKLQEILTKLADFYSREVDNMVRNLTTLLEPIVMVIMGIGVGLLVAAVIMPMYNLAGSM